MGLTLACPRCGAAIRGEDEDELLDETERHIEAEHPGLVGRWTEDDLLEQAVPE
jgi:predicted small metal-binding protein